MFLPSRLDQPLSALKQVENKNDQRGDQKYVYETAQRVRRQESEEPENA